MFAKETAETEGNDPETGSKEFTEVIGGDIKKVPDKSNRQRRSTAK